MPISSFKVLFYPTFFLIGAFCCVSPQKAIKNIPLNEFIQYTFQNKINYLKNNEIDLETPEGEEIFKEVLNRKNNKILQEALQYVIRSKFRGYGKIYKGIVWHDYDFSIRLQAMSVFEYVQPQKNDIVTLLQHSDDEDWLIREKFYQLFRTYEGEQTEQEHYKKILAHLREKNSHVLKEVIKTLLWYKGRSKEVFKKLYTRSFSYKTPLELIMVIEGLSHFKNRLTFRRLKGLANNHESFLVREKAKRLLTNGN